MATCKSLQSHATDVQPLTRTTHYYNISLISLQLADYWNSFHDNVYPVDNPVTTHSSFSQKTLLKSNDHLSFAPLYGQTFDTNP